MQAAPWLTGALSAAERVGAGERRPAARSSSAWRVSAQWPTAPHAASADGGWAQLSVPAPWSTVPPPAQTARDVHSGARRQRGGEDGGRFNSRESNILGAENPY